MIEERKCKLKGWIRALYIVAGLIGVGAGASVLIFPGVGLLFLVALLSVGCNVRPFKNDQFGHSAPKTGEAWGSRN